jgi:hypothetical protein
LAVETVEIADLLTAWQQIDPQRQTKPA